MRLFLHGSMSLFLLLIMQGCFTPVHGGVEMAHAAFERQQNRCKAHKNAAQRAACGQVALQQFAGRVENHMNNWQADDAPDETNFNGFFREEKEVVTYERQDDPFMEEAQLPREPFERMTLEPTKSSPQENEADKIPGYLKRKKTSKEGRVFHDAE